MHPMLRNVLAVIAGLIIGSIVNMLLINISGYVITPPENADVTSMEGLKSAMHVFGPEHVLFPFLAHAFGTFVGDRKSTRLTSSHVKSSYDVFRSRDI